MNLEKIEYAKLNARQKENFNFQKISAVLADYGFVTMRLSDDWQGADFIALHIDGETVLRVQLKSRLTFQKSYCGKGLWIAFGNGDEWFLYPHDDLLKTIEPRASMTPRHGPNAAATPSPASPKIYAPSSPPTASPAARR
jgi:hypothetical protein